MKLYGFPYNDGKRTTSTGTGAPTAALPTRGMEKEEERRKMKKESAEAKRCKISGAMAADI